MRIFSVLLWILFPGCWAVTGPGAVRGSPGGSVTVRCWYQEGYERSPKFWCREGERLFCFNWLRIVETDGSEAEVKRGRVSIRDNHPQRAFTVTVENLTLADAGTYHCGVGRTGPDPTAAVELTISPAPWTTQTTAISSPYPNERTSQATAQPDSPPSKTESSFPPTPHTTPAGLELIIICFLFLGLLKLLLFLCLVSAVIFLSVCARRSHRDLVPEGQAHELPLC